MKRRRPDAIERAQEIMALYSERTGLTDAGVAARRYLWTDAFAVCNYLELHRLTADEKHEQMAQRLVEQVHQTLGRHREDEPRTGWISGHGEEEGRLHPTCGGLRIGKQLKERGPEQPYDERLEWDRDGQYFHYLTKWMQALVRVARVTGQARYVQWAVELAQAAHKGFTYEPGNGGGKRMYWKMSVDLSRPLVSSMGQHDPLDGLITFVELRAAVASGLQSVDMPDLDAQIADMTSMCAGVDWTTDDPLGLGGLLTDAHRAAQLTLEGTLARTGLFEHLLRCSAMGLNALVQRDRFEGSASRRLAFRELGLSIGLQAVSKMRELWERDPERLGGHSVVESLIEGLGRFVSLAERIEDFWLDPENEGSSSWLAHEDINSVMLATSLAPGGYLTL